MEEDEGWEEREGVKGNSDRASTYLNLDFNFNFRMEKCAEGKARPAICTYPRQFTALLLFPTFTQGEKGTQVIFVQGTDRECRKLSTYLTVNTT